MQTLRIELYVMRNFDSESRSYGDRESYGEHHRVRKLYGKPDLQKIIDQEIERKRGRMLVTSKL